MAQSLDSTDWRYVEGDQDDIVGWYEQGGARFRVTWRPNGGLYLLGLDPAHILANEGPTAVSLEPSRDPAVFNSTESEFTIVKENGAVLALDRKSQGRRATRYTRIEEQPYRQRHVEWKSNGLKLRGTILVPNVADKVPGVALIQGSGASGRSNLWAWTFADSLAQQEIAVLIPDKRGSDESQGDWLAASFAELAEDARRSIDLLRQMPEVDSEQCGPVGLSQGGWIAPLVATMAESKFSVSLVASFSTPEKQVMHELRQDVRRFGLAEADVAKLDKACELFAGVVSGETSWEDYQRYANSLRAGLTERAANELLPFDRPSKMIAFWRRIYDFDFPGLVTESGIPQLLVYGALDQRDNTPVDLSLGAVGEVVAANPNVNVELRLYPRVGHTLVDSQSHWVSPRILDDLAAWILFRTRDSTPR